MVEYNMITFLIIGIVAIALLLISLLFDGLFDFLDLDVGGGIVSSASIFGFLGTFGFTGYILGTSTELEGLALYGISIGAGLVLGILVGLFYKALKNSDSGSSDINTLVGTDAQVVSPIPENGRSGYGEIRSFFNGQTNIVSAITDEKEEIGRGKTVIIETIISSTLYKVKIKE